MPGRGAHVKLLRMENKGKKQPSQSSPEPSPEKISEALLGDDVDIQPNPPNRYGYDFQFDCPTPGCTTGIIFGRIEATSYREEIPAQPSSGHCNQCGCDVRTDGLEVVHMTVEQLIDEKWSRLHTLDSQEYHSIHPMK
jgi:hypothetical protein